MIPQSNCCLYYIHNILEIQDILSLKEIFIYDTLIKIGKTYYGLMQEDASVVIIDQSKCIQCELCVKDCVDGLIRNKKGQMIGPKECLECGHCVAVCPKNAISIEGYDQETEIYSGDFANVGAEDFLNLIQMRRSIRQYKDRKVPEKNPENDYLFRNAPSILVIATQNQWDAGLAAQNIENMANTLGMGVLYNGYLARLLNEHDEARLWLGISDLPVAAVLLLGYPSVKYQRSVPRKPLNLIRK